MYAFVFVNKNSRTSERNEGNELEWPKLPFYNNENKVVFGPPNLVHHKTNTLHTPHSIVTIDNWKNPKTDEKHKDEDYYKYTIDSPESVSGTTTPKPYVKPHPLKKPKTQNLPSPEEHKRIHSDLEYCDLIPPGSIGPIHPDTEEETIENVQNKLKEIVLPGGFYTPRECQARQRVAIIVPYRNRPKELAIFLKNIHPFLQKQQLEYGIFIVEQTVGTKFNRAALLNVGFLEAKKIKQFDCFIFHDVDLLPLDDRNLYTCAKHPRHLAVAVDIYHNE